MTIGFDSLAACLMFSFTLLDSGFCLGLSVFGFLRLMFLCGLSFEYVWFLCLCVLGFMCSGFSGWLCFLNLPIWFGFGLVVLVSTLLLIVCCRGDVL